MMKILKIVGILGFILALSGCFKKDSLSNDNVYTTIYPINFLTNYLYGEEKNVTSIYPNGADVSNYELTEKQKDTYSKGALFVYNGLTEEKEIAKEFLDNNNELLLIDVAYGLNYEYSIEELWLSPNNFLMLAENIKSNLLDYTTSKLIKESIENKYFELEVELSYMDAELRSIATDAKTDGNLTLVVSSDKLRFLEDYGFEVVLLDGEINESSIKNKFKNGNYADIYLCDTDEKTDLIKTLEEEYEANVISVNTLFTLSDEEANNNEDYLSIMNTFIDNIRNTALS